jgi:hypothetical protein
MAGIASPGAMVGVRADEHAAIAVVDDDFI